MTPKKSAFHRLPDHLESVGDIRRQRMNEWEDHALLVARFRGDRVRSARADGTPYALLEP